MREKRRAEKILQERKEKDKEKPLSNSNHSDKDQLVDNSDSESVSGDDESEKYGGQIMISDQMVEIVKESLNHNELASSVGKIPQEHPLLPKPPGPSTRKTNKPESKPPRSEKITNSRTGLERKLLASKSSKGIPATSTKPISLEGDDPKKRRRRTFPDEEIAEIAEKQSSAKDERSSTEDCGASVYQEIEIVNGVEGNLADSSLESKSMAALKTIRKLKEAKIARTELPVEVDSDMEGTEQQKTSNEASVALDLQKEEKDDNIDNYRDFLSSDSDDNEKEVQSETGDDLLEIAGIDVVDTRVDSSSAAEMETQDVAVNAHGHFTVKTDIDETESVPVVNVLEINEPVHVFRKENGTYRFNFEPEDLPGLFCWKLVCLLIL
jgi:hypothetical protein